MDNNLDRRMLIGAAGLAGIAALSASRAAAGPLTPPSGAVTGTAKPLAELEPRTAVSAANTPGDGASQYVISQPGSYYLTGNITGASARNAIKITASNVTLYLCGFAITAVPGSTAGISLSNTAQRVCIAHGTISGFALDGIDGGFNLHGRYERLIVTNNGAGTSGRAGIRAGGNATLIACDCSNNVGNGFTCGDACVLETCSADANTGRGINAGNQCTISNCRAGNNGEYGIVVNSGSSLNACAARVNTLDGISTGSGTTVTACSSYNNGGTGISVSTGSVITGCSAAFNTAYGIYGSSASVISDSSAYANNLDGIQVWNTSLVLNCNCANNGNGSLGDAANIHATGTDNLISGNNVTNADRGIDVDAGGNIILKNTSSGNTNNYDIAANNVCYIVQGITSGAIVGASGGNPTGANDPNANYSY